MGPTDVIFMSVLTWTSQLKWNELDAAIDAPDSLRENGGMKGKERKDSREVFFALDNDGQTAIPPNSAMDKQSERFMMRTCEETSLKMSARMKKIK